jgi:hypothetical protein
VMFMCVLSWIVITILMAVEWGKSFRECGPHLYNYGIFVIVMFILCFFGVCRLPDEPGERRKRMTPEQEAKIIEWHRKREFQRNLERQMENRTWRI